MNPHQPVTHRPGRSTVFRLSLFLALALLLNLLVVGDLAAQRGRGGRGGGMRSGGGGSYRPQTTHQRSPSMSRSATQRPATGQRPAASQRPAAGQRGGADRAAGTRAAAQNPRANPSRSDLSNFLGNSGQAGNRAASASGRTTNSAINDFLNQGGAAAAATSATGRQAGAAAQQRAENIGNRTDARSEFRGSRGENRNFASDNRQQRVEGRGDRQATRVANRGDMRASLADGRGDRRTDRQQRRGDAADQIRQNIDDFYDDLLFDDFWRNNPGAYYRFQQNPVFWTWAAASTMRAFMPWNWGTGGGGGGDYYYDNGMVYSDGQSYPAEESAQQAEEIVSKVPEVAEDTEMEWLPLGVFALTKSDDPAAIPNMFLQMAVSKEGIIAGTYQNKESGQTETIEGVADQKSQRAVWTIAGKKTPILETPLMNLTENETNVLVHFEDGSTQQWMMLHVENPKADMSESTPQ